MGGTVCAYEERHGAGRDPRRAPPSVWWTRLSGFRWVRFGEKKPHTKGASRPFQQWAGRFALMRSGMVREENPAAPAHPSWGGHGQAAFVGCGSKKKAAYKRRVPPISTMGGTVCAYEERHGAGRDPRRAPPSVWWTRLSGFRWVRFGEKSRIQKACPAHFNNGRDDLRL